MRKLIIPNDLPNRHWKEMSRSEATNFVLNTGLGMLLVLVVFAVGIFVGQVRVQEKLVSPEIMSNYYQVTGEMPTLSWLEWYNDNYSIFITILTPEEIFENNR
jgi:hypothetical protein